MGLIVTVVYKKRAAAQGVANGSQKYQTIIIIP